MAYTKGPWVIKHIDGGELYVFADKTPIAAVIDQDTDTETEANARLISCVPEMLSLFNDLQEYLTEHDGEAVELLEKIDALLNECGGQE